MTSYNVRIQKRLAAIEAAFLDIKTDIDTKGHAAVGVIIKLHGLPVGISQSMYRLGIIQKDGDSGGAVRCKYEYLTNTTARSIYEDYLSISRAKQKKSRKKSSKPSSKQSDPILSLTPNEVIERPKKPIKHPAKAVAKLSEPFSKLRAKPATKTFELRLFGFSFYKTIRSGL